MAIPSADQVLFDGLLDLGGGLLRSYGSEAVGSGIARRMHALAMRDPRTYVDYCLTIRDEHTILLGQVLNHTTWFFRDPGSWVRLSALLMARYDPPLAHPRHRPLRAWSAGCSTGEEAYTLAIVLAEAIGPGALADVAGFRVFATDLSEECIKVAREGRYPADSMGHVPEDIRQRYFTLHGGTLSARAELRSAICFARHDLLCDPPFRGMDVVSCRNVLPHLLPGAQARVLACLYCAVDSLGFVFVGSSDSPGAESALLETVSRLDRIYRPRPELQRRVQMGLFASLSVKRLG